MPFTQTDLDALDAARKQGARRVRFQDREFEFDSVDDYLKLRNLILNAHSDEGDHYSDLMAISIPSDADHRRSEATLSYSYHP